MPNITMTIDGPLLQQARKVAIEKNESLTSLIRGFLKRLVSHEDSRRDAIVKKLKKLFSRSVAEVGPVSWNRKDLYDR
jgi:hypothetical protein